MVVFDAPQLYEAGADIICDAVIAVVADKGRRMARIIARDGITEEQAESRLQAQLSERFFRENADIIIENNADGEALRRRAEGVWETVANGVS